MKTTISHMTLDHCIMNASGPWCTSYDDLSALDDSMSAAIVTKSMTLEPRLGNPKPRYFQNKLENTTINSTGLANLGFDAYVEYSNTAELSCKPLIFSISGMNLEDNLTMFKRLAAGESSCDYIEFNVSCPNIPGKSQLGYDFEAFDEALRLVSECFPESFGIKMPPYFDDAHFAAVADIVNKYGNIHSLTCINSLGNALIIDPNTEMTVIKPRNGFGGFGGSHIKPTALANVHKFSTLCSKKSIIGCGGITSGIDVFEHILCGARAVQLGSIFAIEGITVFERILKELQGYMDTKGYKSLDDFRGRLKYMS